MSRNMVSLAAFDLILRIIFRGVMYITFVVEVLAVHFDDGTGDPPRFRVPAYLIADLELCFHHQALLIKKIHRNTNPAAANAWQNYSNYSIAGSSSILTLNFWIDIECRC
jgi:hypothetical protein